MSDTMSRSVSAVLKLHEDCSEAAEYDRLFDGGEWSMPAMAQEQAKREEQIAQQFGFANYEAMTKAWQQVCSSRQLHMMGLL